MSVLQESYTAAPRPYPIGFQAMDRLYAEHLPTEDDIDLYGGCHTVIDTQILDNPKQVEQAGHILTNPSQLELINIVINGVAKRVGFAYLREEPPRNHVGRTVTRPVLLLRNKLQQPYLADYDAAQIIPGEDPQLVRGVNLKGRNGKVHRGWLVGTVEVVPEPDSNYSYGKSSKTVLRWGKDLSNLEVINEIEDRKCVVIRPVNPHSGTDTRLHVFGRPHPDITYSQAVDATKITADMLYDGINLTQGHFPPKVHFGVNLATGTHPDHITIQGHEAYAHHFKNEDGKIMKDLYYRLNEWGYEVPSPDHPQGRLTLLGVTASRDTWGDVRVKAPENDVNCYDGVVYGCIGTTGDVLVGAGDNSIGYGRRVRIR